MRLFHPISLTVFVTFGLGGTCAEASVPFSDVGACAGLLTPKEVTNIQTKQVQDVIHDMQSSASASGSEFNAELPIKGVPVGIGASTSSDTNSDTEFTRNYSLDEKHYFLTRYITPYAASAFNTCMSNQQQKSGFHVTTTVEDENKVSLHVRFANATGLTKAPRLVVSADGALENKESVSPMFAGAGGDVSLTFRRLNPAKTLRITLAAQTDKNVNYVSKSLAIPPFRTLSSVPRVFSSEKRNPGSHGECVATTTSIAWGDLALKAPADAYFRPNTFASTTTWIDGGAYNPAGTGIWLKNFSPYLVVARIECAPAVYDKPVQVQVAFTVEGVQYNWSSPQDTGVISAMTTVYDGWKIRTPRSRGGRDR